MSQPGRKTGVNTTGRVREALRSQSARWLPIQNLLTVVGADVSEKRMREILSYLVGQGEAKRQGVGPKAKWKYQVPAKTKPKSKSRGKAKGAADIGTAIHEQVEAYIASSPSLDDRATQVMNVPMDEPEGTFQVTGSLIGPDHAFKGTVVRITSPGFSDRPHLLTEL